MNGTQAEAIQGVDCRRPIRPLAMAIRQTCQHLKVMDGTIVGKKCCPLLFLIRLLLQVSLCTANGLGRSVIILFDPPALHSLTEGGNESVVATVSVAKEEFEEISFGTWNFSLLSYHPDIADAHVDHNQLQIMDFQYDNASKYYSMNTTITVNGRFLGKTGMSLRLVRADSWIEVDEWQGDSALFQHDNEQMLDVWVRRNNDSQRLTKIFVASVIVLISLGNTMMGCELDMSIVLETVKHPVAPAIGFFAQFVIMPLLAYGIAQSVFVSRGLYSMGLGLFITGCSPGGGASNFWTLLLDGNVNLSVTMTFISTLASLLMMPLWISLLGVHFLQGFSYNTKIHVPYGNITRSLASLVIPLLIGVTIKKVRPTWAERSRKVMRPFIIFVLVFVVVFGAISNWYMFRMMTLPALLGGLLLPWCGFMFGCFTSIIMRRSPADVTAIAIETGIQNTGIAILLLKASFSQPDADIGAVLPVIVACFTPGPLLLGATVHMILKAIKKQRQSAVDSSEKRSERVILETSGTPSSLALLPIKPRIDLINVNQHA